MMNPVPHSSKNFAKSLDDISTSDDIAALAHKRRQRIVASDFRVRKALITFEHNLMFVLGIIVGRLQAIHAIIRPISYLTEAERREAFIRESLSIMASVLKKLFSRFF